MGDASYTQTSFLGGEWAKVMQGRFDRPDYRMGLNACVNGFPIEEGAWTRRPGFMFSAHTRGGTNARVIEYAFQQNAPYTLEFTDGYLRFYGGQSLITTNDTQTITSISAANPAKVLTGVHGWSSGNTVVFGNLGTGYPLLQNRQFIATVTSSTQFTLTDALTGATIDGSTLGSLPTGATVSRVMELSTVYVGAAWQTVRSVQADNNSILLHGGFSPQVLSVVTPPTDLAPATFAINAANFQDGPYLDFVSNGATVTPSAVSGLINFVLAFSAYSASISYSKGDFVTSSSVAYKSLTNANFNNTPASSPGFWQVVSVAQAAGPNGFVTTDIGRHIRLCSEPALWASGTTYSAGQTVTYDEQTYWTSLTGSNTGKVPGVDIVNWALNSTAANWTWGRITALLNVIPGNVSGVAHIGDMTSNGGLAGAFNGIQDQNQAASADKGSTAVISNGQHLTVTGYVGQNFSATAATAYAITSATLYPSTDGGLVHSSALAPDVLACVVNLRAKNSAPSNSSDGTLLGTFSFGDSDGSSYVFGTSPVTIVSNDQTTTYAYVWFEIIGTYYMGRVATYNVGVDVIAAQAVINTTAGGSSAGVQVEILGNPLVNTTAVRTWRLGLYNGTVGWPTCGTYHEGRLWLSGSVKNRVDGSQPNQPFADRISFSPTAPDGSVTDSHAISYTFNAPDTNTILDMKPEQQGIIAYTEKGEWLIQATTLNAPLTALNIQAHQVTRIGSSLDSTAVPVQCDHTTVFIQRFKQKVMEYFADIFSGKFAAPNIALTASHLTSRTIQELAYQQTISPVLWARCQDGSLLGCSYKRESLMSSQGPAFAGWHQHTHGGGRQVVSICAGPSANGELDTLACVTSLPTATASGVYHVEFLSTAFRETDTLPNARFLDDAIVPSVSQNIVLGGISTMLLSGLWPLIGQTISVFAGGLDLGDYLVSASGQVNVPYITSNALFTTAFVSGYTGTLPVLVGYTYTSDGQLLRPATPADTGVHAASALGKVRRSHRVAALLSNTQGIYFGTSFDAGKLNKANFQTKGGTAYAANALFSGVFPVPLTDGYGYDSMIAWRITRPFPATVAAIGASLMTQDQ